MFLISLHCFSRNVSFIQIIHFLSFDPLSLLSGVKGEGVGVVMTVDDDCGAILFLRRTCFEGNLKRNP